MTRRLQFCHRIDERECAARREFRTKFAADFRTASVETHGCFARWPDRSPVPPESLERERIDAEESIENSVAALLAEWPERVSETSDENAGAISGSR